MATMDREYHNIHHWLRQTHGKADRCESNICQGRSKSYHWALKKGCQYSRNRDLFFMLCQSCHGFYDMTDDRRGKSSKNMRGKNGNNSKLTAKQVLEIRRDYIPIKVSARMLGKKYRVSTSNINRIIKRESWKHI